MCTSGNGCIPGLLDGMVEAGAETIEIFAARGHFDYANRKQHIVEIGNWFRTSGIKLNSVHSPLTMDYEWGKRGGPSLNIAEVDKRPRIEAMDEIKRAIEIAEQIPFKYLVQHIGVGGEEFDEKKLDAAMTSRRAPESLREATRRDRPAGKHPQ